MPLPLRTFDPETGKLALRNHRAADGPALSSMVFCGDWAPGDGPQSDGSLTGLQETLRQADLAVVNVEVVLGGDDLAESTKDGVRLRRPPEAARRLAEVPFHVACLANNHVMDYGEPGLASTLYHLERNGIQAVGAGLAAAQAEQPLLCQVGEAAVALINVAEGEEARSVGGGAGAASLDRSRLERQILDLGGPRSIVVVVVHAGREYLPVPAPQIRRLYHALVDAGASLVIGSHPHVPQGLEVVGDSLVAYSLGNLNLFDESGSALRRRGYALKADFDGKRVVSVEAIPYRIERQGPILLEGGERRDFLLQLQGLNRLAANPKAAEAVWEAYVDRWLLGVGLPELSESIALVGGSRWLLRSALLHVLGLDYQQAGRSRMLRSVGWRLAGALKPNVLSRNEASRQGAAVLRNRFDTLSHREVYLLALQRVMEDRVGHAPSWAYNLLDEWQVQ